jgi:hypothetical protein
MPHQEFDKSSKWLLEYHGSSVLRLGGLRDIGFCRSLQADVVQPRHLPDGLLEFRLRGQTRTRLMLVEVATYPEQRVVQQFVSGVTGSDETAFSRSDVVGSFWRKTNHDRFAVDP